MAHGTSASSGDVLEPSLLCTRCISRRLQPLCYGQDVAPEDKMQSSGQCRSTIWSWSEALLTRETCRGSSRCCAGSDVQASATSTRLPQDMLGEERSLPGVGRSLLASRCFSALLVSIPTRVGVRQRTASILVCSSSE